MTAPAVIIAAPASGCGKTTVVLGLLRRFRDLGIAVASAKVGPDYIDPRFHAAASGRSCLNLDPWAMRPATLARLAAEAGQGAEVLIVEGVMGLFDGAVDGTGSTADLAAQMNWPVVLVIDAHAQAQSAAALVHGFATWRPQVRIAGIIFNRIGGPSHEALLRTALAPLGIPVLGALPRLSALALPERHLGLVQAAEHPDLETFIAQAADQIGRGIDTTALIALTASSPPPSPQPLHRRGGGAVGTSPPPHRSSSDQRSCRPPLPLGQRIAIAGDLGFAFVYPHLLADWRVQGAELLAFSPLADQAPDPDADAVYLPGGYPELFAGRLAGNHVFLDGLRAAAARGAVIYGECGGYMVLGRALIDSEGIGHQMAGLLPVTTSFAQRRLHLGYRRATLCRDTPLGGAGTAWRGHEFHYASVIDGDGGADALFEATDAGGRALGRVGASAGRVIGSFLHLVDPE